MARPTLPAFDWASDATHPASPDAWGGQPNKVAPSAPEVAQGWQPNVEPPAEYMNAIQHRLGRWARYLEGLTAVRTLIIPSNELIPQTASGFEIVNGASLSPSINDSVLHLDGSVANGLYRAGLSFASYLPRDAQIESIRVTGVAGVSGEELSIVDYVRGTHTSVIESAYPGGTSIVLGTSFDITVTPNAPLAVFPAGGGTRCLRFAWNATQGAPFNGGTIYAVAVQYSRIPAA